MGRAPCCDKANVKKGPWSPEEDAKLKVYVEQNGTGGNWIALPQKIGLKRCGKSCRLRWLNYLRPNIKHGGFSEEEDHIICSLYLSIGSRWSIIAAQLPGRTDNDIKNYWNTRLKKKLLGKQLKEEHARRASCIKNDQNTEMPGFMASSHESMYPFPNHYCFYYDDQQPTTNFPYDFMTTQDQPCHNSINAFSSSSSKTGTSMRNNSFPVLNGGDHSVVNEGGTTTCQGLENFPLLMELDEDIVYGNPRGYDTLETSFSSSSGMEMVISGSSVTGSGTSTSSQSTSWEEDIISYLIYSPMH